MAITHVLNGSKVNVNVNVTENEDQFRLKTDAKHSGVKEPKFRTNLLLPHIPYTWKQQVSPKCRFLSTNLTGVTIES
jgi:hypothetical protein